MLAAMTAAQWVEWQAFLRIEGPLSEERADRRAAVIAWAVASANAVDAKFDVEDFLLKYEAAGPAEEQSPEEIETALRRTLGGP